MLQGLLVIRMPVILIVLFKDGLVYRRVNTSDSRQETTRSSKRLVVEPLLSGATLSHWAIKYIHVFHPADQPEAVH